MGMLASKSAHMLFYSDIRKDYVTSKRSGSNKEQGKEK